MIMATRLAWAFFLLLLSIATVAESRGFIKLPSEVTDFFHAGKEEISGGDDDTVVGTRWAVLLAGSNGYWNYRHQVIRSWYFFYFFLFSLPTLLSFIFFCMHIIIVIFYFGERNDWIFSVSGQNYENIWCSDEFCNRLSGRSFFKFWILFVCVEFLCSACQVFEFVQLSCFLLNGRQVYLQR